MKRIWTLVPALLMTAMLATQTACSTNEDVEKFGKPNVNKPGGDDNGDDGGDEGGDDGVYTLKQLAAAAGIQFGLACTQSEFSNSTVAGLVTSHADNVTFGNEMKNASIMQSSGSLSFTAADALLNSIKTASPNMKFFGHVLGWHSQQQTGFLNPLTTTAVPDYTNRKFYTNFEDGVIPSAWCSTTANPAGSGAFTVTTDPKQVFAGDKALKVEVTIAAGDNDAYKCRLQPTAPNAVNGKVYALSCWVKAAEAGGKIRVSTDETTGQYLSFLSTSTTWTKYTFPVTAATVKADGILTLYVDMASVANTYYVDNLSIVELTPGAGSSDPVNLIGATDDGTFESATAYPYGTWVKNGSNATPAISTTVAHGGTKSLEVTVIADGAEYSAQYMTPIFPVTVGHTYSCTFWIKSKNGLGAIQTSKRSYSVNNNAFENNSESGYSGTTVLSTEWEKKTVEYTAPATIGADPDIRNVSYARLSLNLGKYADVIYIDDVVIIDKNAVVVGGDGDVIPALGTSTDIMGETVFDRVDYTLRRWVFGMMEHYGDKVYAWDAINETVSDSGGALRSSANTTASGQVFLWGDYLGGAEAFVVKTFKYARAAQSDAQLYINDYGLESNTKRTAFVNLVNKVKTEHPGLIDGVATQMHIRSTTTRQQMDDMFTALASTGLKVRISELDIAMNPDKTAGYVFDATADAALGQLYKNVIESYFSKVPAAQRQGITIWGTKDDMSWLTNQYSGNEQYPLLFNADGSKKKAFEGFYNALKAQTTLE